MEKINAELLSEINGAIKKQFNFGELYTIVIDNYVDNEGWHKHEICTQIIYVINGIIRVLSQYPTNSECISSGEFLSISVNEWYKIVPETENVKLLIIKYREIGINISREIRNDYIR